MPGCWTAVNQRGKNGQSIGCVMRRGRTWTTSLPIALMPTLTPRATEVGKWQQTYRVDWDATDDRNGRAPHTVWEMLLEMERFKYRAGEEDLGAVALVVRMTGSLIARFLSVQSGVRLQRGYVGFNTPSCRTHLNNC